MKMPGNYQFYKYILDNYLRCTMIVKSKIYY